MNDPRLRQHELGFWDVVDKPSPQALADYYAQTYYQNETSNYRKSYSLLEREVINLRVAQRAAQVRTLSASAPPPPRSMLDVGCGEGFALNHFRSLGWQVTGIDFSRAGVEQMHPECAPLVEQGDVFQLLDARIARGEKHDLIWLGNVLEHVLNPLGLLQSLRDLVSVDGLLVVTVPNDGNAYQEELFENKSISSRFWIAIPDHISYFTAESLKRIASATGWQCLTLQGDFPIDWYLAHEGSNYVSDPTRGPAAHQARLQLERLIGKAGHEAANGYYTALADVGLGRNITAYLRPQPKKENTCAPPKTLVGSTATEIDRKLELAQRLRHSPVPDHELLDNLGLYLTRQTLSRINFMQNLYGMIIPVHGIIMEFGVRWGQNMALFSSLRGIHEPFNYNRRIIGFDTFEGFPSVAPEDGSLVKSGDYSVVTDWMHELDAILDNHSQGSPIPHKKKHQLVQGDATVTLPAYLREHPETVIALAYFDFDLYMPTRDCLEAILPFLTKGSVLAFDELNTPEFPGETIAVREVLGLSRHAIRRDPSNPLTSYLVIE